jgi:hypothetical protein
MICASLFYEAIRDEDRRGLTIATASHLAIAVAATAHLLALFGGEEGGECLFRGLVNLAELGPLGVANADRFHGVLGILALGDRALQLLLLGGGQDALDLLASLLGDLGDLGFLGVGQVEGGELRESGFELGFLGVGEVELGYGHAGVETRDYGILQLLLLGWGEDRVDFGLHFGALGVHFSPAGRVGLALGDLGLAGGSVSLGGDRGNEEDACDRGNEDCFEGGGVHGGCD